MHIADLLIRHSPMMSETSNREHVLLARSTFKEDLEGEQNIQEVNHLLLREHEAVLFRVQINNNKVLRDVKAFAQSRWP